MAAGKDENTSSGLRRDPFPFILGGVTNSPVFMNHKESHSWPSLSVSSSIVTLPLPYSYCFPLLYSILSHLLSTIHSLILCSFKTSHLSLNSFQFLSYTYTLCVTDCSSSGFFVSRPKVRSRFDFLLHFVVSVDGWSFNLGVFCYLNEFESNPFRFGFWNLIVFVWWMIICVLIPALLWTLFRFGSCLWLR